MKFPAFSAISYQGRVAALSIATTILIVVGSGVYSSTPGGRNLVQKIYKLIPQTAAQSPLHESTATTVQPEITEQENTEQPVESTAADAAVTSGLLQGSSLERRQNSEPTATYQAMENDETQKETDVSITEVTQNTVPVETSATITMTITQDNSGRYNSDMAYAVLDLVNQQRAAAGLSNLLWDDGLASNADIRASEIVIKWSHTRPDGSEWYTAGSQTQCGENLAVGQTTAQQAVTDWMNSPAHAGNVLGNYSAIGVSCYLCHDIYYWALQFA